MSRRKLREMAEKQKGSEEALKLYNGDEND